MFCFRDEFGQWDPKNQRPELWSLYNGRIHSGEQSACSRSRTGPSSTSGTTSRARSIELPSIYFAHEREVFERDGMLYAANEFMPPDGRRAVVHEHGPLPHGRRRDLHRRGRSDADTVDEVIAEVAATRITERGATRADDRVSEAAMEDRKKEGYF